MSDNSPFSRDDLDAIARSHFTMHQCLHLALEDTYRLTPAMALFLSIGHCKMSAALGLSTSDCPKLPTEIPKGITKKSFDFASKLRDLIRIREGIVLQIELPVICENPDDEDWVLIKHEHSTYIWIYGDTYEAALRNASAYANAHKDALLATEKESKSRYQKFCQNLPFSRKSTERGS